MKHEEGIKWFMAFRRKRTLILVLIPISLFILWVVQKNEKVAEFVFARGIYRLLSQGISLITGAIPLSIMEILLIILPIISLAIFLHFVWKLVHSDASGQKIGYKVTTGFLNIGCTLSVILFLFVILGGVNYYRTPFASFSGLEIKDSSVDELYSLSISLAEDAAKLRSQLEMLDVNEDGNISEITWTNWSSVSKEAEASFDKLSKQYPFLEGNYGAPKPVYFSQFMSRMEITGIFWPFTMEANVNIDVPSYTIRATMLHELAHLRGFMREDEANFIAYLASKESDDPAFQYSGVMLALTYTTNQLYKHSPELYNQVRDYYNFGMISDLRQNYYYWEAFEDTVISTVANNMNDTYLKVNAQEDGVRSYGRMVDLLLAEHRKEMVVQK